jgi:hypothetical protein
MSSPPYPQVASVLPGLIHFTNPFYLEKGREEDIIRLSRKLETGEETESKPDKVSSPPPSINLKPKLKLTSIKQ